MQAKGAFETRDFYLACFLRCTGYELLDLRAEGRADLGFARQALNCQGSAPIYNWLSLLKTYPVWESVFR
jgi:hypothetical protein